MARSQKKHAFRFPAPAEAVSNTGDPGPVILKLRKEKNLLLTDLAKLSGVAASTISRIENGKISPTYGVLARLGDALGVRWSDILGTAESSFAPGCRAVDRANSGIKQNTARGVYEWLGTDLVTKDMEPTVIDAVAERGPPLLEGHTGQELIYVLKGTIVFHMQHYASLLLETGDSVYFDANTPHASYSRDGPARFLSIVSRPR